MGIRITNHDDEGAGGDWEPCPPGTYRAVISKVWDVGWQKPYQDNRADFCKHMIVIDYEVDQTMPGSEKNYILGTPYNATLKSDKAKLRQPVYAAFPEGLTDEQKKSFDVESLVGATVMVAVGWNKKGDRTRVDSVSPLAKGMQPMEATEQYDEPFGLADFMAGKSISEAEAKEWNDNARAEKDDSIPF